MQKKERKDFAQQGGTNNYLCAQQEIKQKMEAKGIQLIDE